MRITLALVLVAALFVLGTLGATPALQWTFAVVLPYLAVTLFLLGIVWRVVGWARVPVPFRIPTTCGQQRSLPWFRQQKLENPHTGLQAFGRMVLEVLLFRSLLRNTSSSMNRDKRLVYTTDLSLWAGAMAFHWSMALILLRHLRLFTEPTPAFVTAAESLDGFLEVGVPVVFASTVVFLLALTYLLVRRMANPLVRYISLVGDYFPLLLLLTIGGTGFWMRHVAKVDVAAVKELALGLVRFSPTVPASVEPLFYGHLFLVCVLLAYFPVSKLVHMAGVFLSPTRNLANDNRRRRHVNPQNPEVEPHTYEEWEDEFRDKLLAAGIPVERA
jgi:[DsrC]-trisulfide reductase subunit M